MAIPAFAAGSRTQPGAGVDRTHRRGWLSLKVDSGPNGVIRNTFEAVPDAPVEKFELNLKGGPKYSLLVNSENICKKPQRAIERFTAQNGKKSGSAGKKHGKK